MPRVWKSFPDVVGDSSLAMRLDDDADDWRGGDERPLEDPVELLVIHMSGRNIVKQALDRGLDPIEHAFAYYTTKRTSSHYLGGYNGELWQMTDDRIRVGHVGVSADERRAYLDGRWQRGKRARGQRGEWLDAPNDFTIEKWREAFPGHKSPQHLFAARSVNDRSVGIEFVPCLYGSRYVAEPLREGLWHTAAQHVAAALLACDLAARWGWPEGWHRVPGDGLRLLSVLGHEDVDLYGRSQASGGWDPGALRTSPRWDWLFVYHLISVRLGLPLGRFLGVVGDTLGRTVAALFR